MKQGRLTLIGAGPGAGGLLTRRAAAVLREAQVVMADRLVGPDILALIPPSAEVVDVGKRSGDHPVPQHEINRILLEQVRAGKRVVRLKGGDPYLFGRGAEEIKGVAAEGYPFEVIPGISAALAVPALAGIPVTHRDFASSVHIVTGHAQAGGVLDIDFGSLVKAGGTLVFLMGLAALTGILRGLLDAGIRPDMPAAMIQDGTLPTQRKVVAAVATLEAEVQRAKLAPPAVLVVGEVCALSEAYDFREKLPLAGKTVLVTRPQQADSELADKLEALGAGVVRFPCIHLAPCTPEALPEKLVIYNWVVLTSAYGAELFFEQHRARGEDIRTLAGIRFAAIGARTAREIEKRGIRVDFTPDVYDAQHLATGLVEQIGDGQRALLFRAKAGTPELPRVLRGAGIAFDDVAAYDTIHQNPASERIRAMLKDGAVDYVTFTSASTVEGFVRAVGVHEGFTGICIGRSTAKRAQECGIPVAVSAAATVDSMVETILERAEVKTK